jgi:murein tripeptide amidase MpaA
VLVGGVIHGNEPGGDATALALEGRVPKPGTSVVIVPDLNPDGVAANSRQNAAGWI